MADRRYAEIARMVGLPARTVEEGVQSLIEAVRHLMQKVRMPLTLAELGIERNRFMSLLPELAERAFDDQTTTANPRMPLMTELQQILMNAYGGS